MSFLGLEDKAVLVAGAANKRSIATHVTRVLLQEGAKPILTVQDAAHQDSVRKLFPDLAMIQCNVEKEEDLRRLGEEALQYAPLAGFLHAIAFADFSEGMKPFHETKRASFLQAAQISMFSFVEMAKALAPALAKDASAVALSICTTAMAAESYGYMAPIKAALDSSAVFLAKSFSAFSEIRFNTVNAGLLKTSASAGIPGYTDNYIFAEQATLRKRALKTEEVANLVVFLLSSASSGINGQRHVIDAGMGVNYFDAAIVQAVAAQEGL